MNGAEPPLLAGALPRLRDLQPTASQPNDGSLVGDRSSGSARGCGLAGAAADQRCSCQQPLRRCDRVRRPIRVPPPPLCGRAGSWHSPFGERAGSDVCSFDQDAAVLKLTGSWPGQRTAHDRARGGGRPAAAAGAAAAIVCSRLADQHQLCLASSVTALPSPSPLLSSITADRACCTGYTPSGVCAQLQLVQPPDPNVRDDAALCPCLHLASLWRQPLVCERSGTVVSQCRPQVPGVKRV